MPKALADIDTRRFFDEFEKVGVSRFRAMGVIDPSRREALIPFPNGKVKLIGTAHTRFPQGGGYSYFVCPKCARLARYLYLIEDAPLCIRCCEAMNIRHATKYALGSDARRRASDRKLDQLIAKLEAKEPLRLKPVPPSWVGRGSIVYNSRKLAKSMRRRMISLRLGQLASLQETDGRLKITRGHKPRAEALALIPELKQVWRANTHERLQRALDKAQTAILKALECDDPKKRIIAASLMMRTKQGRERGFGR